MKHAAKAGIWTLDWIITGSALLAGACIKVRTSLKRAAR